MHAVQRAHLIMHSQLHIQKVIFKSTLLSIDVHQIQIQIRMTVNPPLPSFQMESLQVVRSRSPFKDHRLPITSVVSSPLVEGPADRATDRPIDRGMNMAFWRNPLPSSVRPSSPPSLHPLPLSRSLSPRRTNDGLPSSLFLSLPL